MPYCSKCGVQVGNDIHKCPLCDFPIPNINKYDEDRKKFPDPENSYPLKLLAKKRRWLSIITTLLLIIGGLVLFIDYRVDKNISWAWIVTSCLVATWVYTFLLFNFINNYYINIFLFSLTTIAFTSSLDYVLDKEISWFYSLALPATFMFTVLALIFTFLFNKTKKRGINVVSFILLPAGVYCVWIEGFISQFLLGKIVLYWSIIVLIIAFPISFLLLYLHYGISEKYWVKLKRKFHF